MEEDIPASPEFCRRISLEKYEEEKKTYTEQELSKLKKSEEFKIWQKVQRDQNLLKVYWVLMIISFGVLVFQIATNNKVSEPVFDTNYYISFVINRSKAYIEELKENIQNIEVSILVGSYGFLLLVCLGISIIFRKFFRGLFGILAGLCVMDYVFSNYTSRDLFDPQTHVYISLALIATVLSFLVVGDIIIPVMIAITISIAIKNGLAAYEMGPDLNFVALASFFSLFFLIANSTTYINLREAQKKNKKD